VNELDFIVENANKYAEIQLVILLLRAILFILTNRNIKLLKVISRE